MLDCPLWLIYEHNKGGGGEGGRDEDKERGGGEGDWRGMLHSPVVSQIGVHVVCEWC